MKSMSDRQIADKTFSSPFIDPEYYAELLHRGLSGPGMFKEDTYALIESRESLAIKDYWFANMLYVNQYKAFEICSFSRPVFGNYPYSIRRGLLLEMSNAVGKIPLRN